MSADNYLFVGEDEDGKYTVSHRCASVFYSDEAEGEAPYQYHTLEGNTKGWTLHGDPANEGKYFETMDEALESATRRPDWLEDPPEPMYVTENIYDALMFAHRTAQKMDILEYGVKVGVPLNG